MKGQVDAGKAELAAARAIDKTIDARAAKFGLVAPAASSAQTPVAGQPSG